MSQPVLFLDLDGTLIGHSGEVDPTLWPHLERARALGQRLCVCTGRPSGGIASRVAARLDPQAPHVFHGGAVVRRGDEVLDARAIDPDLILPLIELSLTLDPSRCALEVYTPDAIYVGRPSPPSERHGLAIGVPSRVADSLEDLVTSHTIVKLQWVTDDDDLVAELESSTPASLFAASASSHALPGDHFVTVTARGVDKGSAVALVASSLGVSLSECAAVGDSEGDVPMLDVVGHPWIMGNASKSLRSRYPNLAHIDDHGVLPVLAT